jgi:uncharacterized phage protein (TIGR02218 family)
LKTLPTALAAHYDTGATTTAYGLKITRTDGEVFGFTSGVSSAVIDAVTYDATQGLDITGIVTSAGFAVDNLELTTLDDGSLFTHSDVIGGRWQNAAFLIFRYNWASVADGTEPIIAGTVGNVTLRRGSIVAELRGLQQYLQQPIGNVTTRTCRARFADFPTPNQNNLCRLSASDYIDEGEVTEVTSRQVFEADIQSITSEPPEDYYGEGVLTWTSGTNEGLRVKVKSYTAAGVVGLMLPLPTDPQVGDTFEIVAGCRKRLQEDCRDKFDNVLNFQGEPHLPGVDFLTANPDAAV